MKSNVTVTTFALAALVVAIVMTGCGGDGPTIQPTTNPAVSSVSLTPSSVTLPATSTGRVTLTGAAPASGSSVTLRSTDTSQATVPASVTVGSGSTTADFTVTAVSAGSPRIEASLNGVTQGATLTINGPVARFRVDSNPGAVSNSCPMAVGGGNLNCTFDGTASTGNNLTYQWSYTLPGQTLTGSGPTLTNPPAGCNFFAGITTKTSGNPFQLIVSLRVIDGAGITSALTTNQNVQITPLNNTCGFVF